MQTSLDSPEGIEDKNEGREERNETWGESRTKDLHESKWFEGVTENFPHSIADKVEAIVAFREFIASSHGEPIKSRKCSCHRIIIRRTSSEGHPRLNNEATALCMELFLIPGPRIGNR